MLRFLSAITRNTLGRKSTSSHVQASSILSVVIHRQGNPEPQHRYEPGGYHVVLPGEVYNQRYQIIRKLGWGLYSTVWLVQDTRDQSLAAMKILVGDLTIADKNDSWDEFGMLKVIGENDPHSRGYRHVCQLLDNFTLRGPNGTRICLVLEGVSFSVLDVYRALPGAMPLPLLKRMCKHVLCALEYLHEDCGIIHTDIKGDNILMGGAQFDEGQSIIEVDNDFLTSTTFKLSDFGAANTMSNRFAEVIQPESLRSPEVIIGTEWDTKIALKNSISTQIYEFARGSKLFDPHWDNEKSGMNPVQTHLSQITGLCGNFPHEFRASGKRSKLYFDNQGSLLRGAGQYSITLKDLLSKAGHTPEELCEIVDFLSLMLAIDPKERWPAARLLDHPWLKDIE